MKYIFLALFMLPVFCQAQYTGTASVTEGLASTTVSNLYSCSGGRITNIGIITATDKSVWTVPAETNFTDTSFPFASNLYNSCTGATYTNEPAALKALTGSDIVTIDSDGELITAYIFADNYFEMYINGIGVGKDNVPFTQFNSNIIRFKVKRPFTIAMLLVDWEENLGLGSENNNGFSYHPGDGGMVAVFKDSKENIIAKTGSDWKAQTYYTAPITNLTCPTENGNLRLSTNCSTADVMDGSKYYGLHWDRPNNWMKTNYDDSNWPAAYTYANAIVGVDNKPAYTNFTSIFDAAENDAQFIWSSNLILDNEVLVRKTVPIITNIEDDAQGVDIEIYPNPVRKEMYIKTNTPSKINQVQITNSYGIKIYLTENFIEKIDLFSFPKGIYIVSIETNNTTILRKIILQ